MEVWTKDDVVAFTKYTPGYIDQLVTLDKIPFRRPGGVGLPRFIREEIEAWLLMPPKERKRKTKRAEPTLSPYQRAKLAVRSLKTDDPGASPQKAG